MIRLSYTKEQTDFGETKKSIFLSKEYKYTRGTGFPLSIEEAKSLLNELGELLERIEEHEAD